MSSIFSSPEPKAQGEFIVWDSSRRLNEHTFKREDLPIWLEMTSEQSQNFCGRVRNFVTLSLIF